MNHPQNHARDLPGSRRAAALRVPAIDALKAVAIVVIPMIHTFSYPQAPPHPVRQAFRFVSRFAVPAFFFASGFLANRPDAPWTVEYLRSRLRRLLVPYFVASFVAFCFYHTLAGRRLDPFNTLLALATGAASGVYYFVPLLLGTTLLSPLLPRGPRGAVALWAPFGIAGWLVEMGHLRLPTMYWEFRNPLRWWGYYFAGWAAAAIFFGKPELPTHKLRKAGFRACAAMAAGAFALAQVPAAPWAPFAAGTLQYVFIYAAIGVVALSPPASKPRPTFQWLSAATYPIYLYHIFFVELGRRWWGWSGFPSQFTTFAFALAGSVGLVALARTLFGHRARTWLG